MFRNMTLFLVLLLSVLVFKASAATESSVAIPQEVSEIRTKPTDSLKTEDGVRQLSQIQGMYRENIVVRSNASTRPASRTRVVVRPRPAAKRVAKAPAKRSTVNTAAKLAE